MTATSINFADVLNVYGRYSSFEGRQELGVDFAGVVTAVGEESRSIRSVTGWVA